MRRKDREITDIGEIERIISQSEILHLAMLDGDYPYLVPLHFGYERREGKFVFYMHSAKEGHKLDAIKRNGHVCAELENSVALLAGGENPCAYGSAFASVIVRGTARVLDDNEEKMRALKLLMKHQTGRDFDFDAKAASSVSVIELTSESVSAKMRKA